MSRAWGMWGNTPVLLVLGQSRERRKLRPARLGTGVGLERQVWCEQIVQGTRVPELDGKQEAPPYRERS